MNAYDILSTVHASTAMLLLSLALIATLISVLIAVKPAADPANERLLSRANTVGLIEQVVVGIVTASGVVAVLLTSFSLSQPWLWMSLMIMVFYSAALKFITKPSREAVAEGGSAAKSGLQVVLQIGHVLLLIIAFFLMVSKPVLL